jgi:Zn-dependent membrane protease YugP
MMTWLLLIGVPLLLGLWAQMRVSSAFGRWKQVAATSGVTGAQAAREILSAANINDVEVLEVNDCSAIITTQPKRLCLSTDVYNTRPSRLWGSPRTNAVMRSSIKRPTRP